MQEINFNIHDDLSLQDVFKIAKEFMTDRILNDLKKQNVIYYNFRFNLQLIVKKKDNEITAELIRKG